MALLIAKLTVLPRLIVKPMAALAKKRGQLAKLITTTIK